MLRMTLKDQLVKIILLNFAPKYISRFYSWSPHLLFIILYFVKHNARNVKIRELLELSKSSIKITSEELARYVSHLRQPTDDETNNDNAIRQIASLLNLSVVLFLFTLSNLISKTIYNKIGRVICQRREQCCYVSRED